MEKFRSKSYRNGRSMQVDDRHNYDIANFSDNNGAEPPNYQANANPSGMQDLRCYSASYASSSSASIAQRTVSSTSWWRATAAAEITSFQNFVGLSVSDGYIATSSETNEEVKQQ